MIEDIPLPGMPDPPGRIPVSSIGRVYVTRYRPPARRSCADCVTARHLGGTDELHPVRWRYHEGALTLHLCEIHKEQRLEKP